MNKLRQINIPALIYILGSAFLLGALMVIIFLLSHETADDSRETSGFIYDLLVKIFGSSPPMDIIRTCAHFAEYTLFGILTANYGYSIIYKERKGVSIAVGCIYALSDEIHQFFIPGRAFQISDLLVDSCGVILGVFLFAGLIRIIKRSKKNKLQNNKDKITQ